MPSREHLVKQPPLSRIHTAMNPVFHPSTSPLPAPSRRQWLQRTSAGFGYLALSALATQRALADSAAPLAPKQPHFPARAKRVLFL